VTIDQTNDETWDEQPQQRRWPIWPWLVLAVAGVVVTAVAAIFGTVSDDDPDVARAATGQTELTVVRVETSTVTATVTVAAPPAGPAVQLVNGLHQVGVNVVPGTFRTPGPDGSNSGGCYWSRTSATTGDLVDNGVLSGQGTITVGPEELVEVAGCQPWVLTF
jgi:hypothetical protein